MNWGLKMFRVDISKKNWISRQCLLFSCICEEYGRYAPYYALKARTVLTRIQNVYKS